MAHAQRHMPYMQGAAKGEQTVNGKATGTSLQINNKPGEYLTLCEVKVFGY